MIEVLPGCSRNVIQRWLAGLPAETREGIEVVSIDPSNAYRHAIQAALRAQAERRLDAFLLAVDHAALPAFDAFAKGIRSWREELLGYFNEPTTNGCAGGVINKVKVIKRRAYGIPTFAGCQKRVVIAFG